MNTLCMDKVAKNASICLGAAVLLFLFTGHGVVAASTAAVSPGQVPVNAVFEVPVGMHVNAPDDMFDVRLDAVSDDASKTPPSRTRLYVAAGGGADSGAGRPASPAVPGVLAPSVPAVDGLELAPAGAAQDRDRNDKSAVDSLTDTLDALRNRSQGRGTAFIEDAVPLDPSDSDKKNQPTRSGSTPATSTPALSARELELQRRGIVAAELRPSRPAVISVDAPAMVASITVQDGEKVTQGQVVAVLDAKKLEKQLEEARKDVTAAVERVQNSLTGSSSQQQTAQSELARYADRVRELEERIAAASLAAPFDGRVTLVNVVAGQHLKRGEALMELAREGDVEIICTVPSSWVSRLKEGHLIWVFIEETGKSYEALFIRFGGRVSAATKTIRAYSGFKEKHEELLPGMSGRADFFPRSKK